MYRDVAGIRNSRRGVVLFIALLGLCLNSHAGDVLLNVPPGVRVIDAEMLVKMAEEQPGLLMIDSRLQSDRLQGYIEGAISLPNTKTTCESLAAVTTGYDQPLVFYCNGIACDRSAKAIRVAHRCGYKKVHWFQGGFKEWKTKKYPYIK